MNRIAFFALALALAPAAFADEDPAGLGPKPSVIKGVKTHPLELLKELFPFEAFNNKSDIEKLISLQSPVKSQGSRGTCSIFSATAALESLIEIRDGEELDLAENYLEYTVMTRKKQWASEGSDTPLNFPAFRDYGTVREESWPYEKYDWSKPEKLPADEKARADAKCGDLSDNALQACLLSHERPDTDPYRKEAKQFRYDYGLKNLRYGYASTQYAIKKLLDDNRPVILSVEFFYGAWNHRLMVDYGIGERNMTEWYQGVVSTPTDDDVEKSRAHPAGHSILVVGYDDVEKVYYFKNSWGTSEFGRESGLLGPGTTAGYGTITYGYAHEHGTFYEIGLP